MATNHLVPRILSKVECFSIHGKDPSDVYMRRFTLLRTRWGKLCLHQFLRSDADLCLHDHPFRFLTLILAGGYREIMPNGVRWREPGSLLYRPAVFKHRIEVDYPAWSLVWMCKTTRPWGFWTKLGWRRFQAGQPPICEEPKIRPVRRNKLPPAWI